MTGEIVAGNKVRSMHPQKFAMWLFLVSVVMIFISLSSAYVVKKSIGEWIYIELPSLFKFTTGVIILSSMTIHFAYISAKRGHIKNTRIGLGITSILAVVFILGQLQAWGQLVDGGYHLVGNPASSFIYIFTGIHVVHLIGAVIFLLIILKKAFNQKPHTNSLVRIEMCITFWHFLGGLWLYLYLFLILNN